MKNNQIELQPASYDIWDSKYRLKDSNGLPIDHNIEDTLIRVAKALAEVEPTRQEYWYEQFLGAMMSGAIPAGRILSNAGASQYKSNTSLINCTVSGKIHDSMDSILSVLHDAGMTLKAGCGIGYEFSTLRPKGAYVAGAGAYTSGPLSFMDIYDKMCATVSSAGGRRGAQMATFDIRHPDVIEFIKAKREDGRLRQFNLSLLITNEFMKAVKEDQPWNLIFPLNEQGQVYRTVNARNLWNLIMESTYDYAEPGFILIDEVNGMNNNWFCEEIRATNPCGEVPLPPHGSCLLGSIDLTRFISQPFSNRVRFDWDSYRKVIRVFTRMLDNVVEISGLPLPEQRLELERKRRHGMGYFGLGSAFVMMNLKYGDETSIQFTKEVTKALAIEGYRTGLALAKEKGAAPIMREEFEVNGQMQKGKVLHSQSQYMQRIRDVDSSLVDELRVVGCRFTHHSSIAPTGTIALSLGNNASNGIEPSFSHHYFRNVIKPGKKTKEQVPVFSKEALLFGQEPYPSSFITANEVTPKQHIDIQAAAQYWIDASISKTVNVATDYPLEDFKGLYQYAYEKGLKGCATFRFNPTRFQGVLVNESDLKNTTYQFTLDDGSQVVVSGHEQIEYDGEIHSAANLFDSLKEGLYGKY